jgi:hypothetical protein
MLDTAQLAAVLISLDLALLLTDWAAAGVSAVLMKYTPNTLATVAAHLCCRLLLPSCCRSCWTLRSWQHVLLSLDLVLLLPRWDAVGVSAVLTKCTPSTTVILLLICV